MASFGHLIKGTTYLVVGGQIARVITFVQATILIRYLGTTKYGLWSLAQALPSALGVLTDLGLNSLMQRVVARDKHQQARIVEQVLGLKLVLSVLFLVAIWLCLLWSTHTSELKILTMGVALAVVAGLYSELVIQLCQAHENFTFSAIFEIVKAVLSLAFVAAVVLAGLGLRSLVMATIGLSFILSSAVLIWYGRTNPITFHLHSTADYLSNLKNALPFAIYNLVNPLFMQIDLIMLGWLSTLSSVGIYSAAYRLVVFVYFLPMALQRTIFPRLSRSYRAYREEYEAVLNKAFELCLLVALPAAVGLWLIADSIVPLLLSDAYRESVSPLKILALSIPFYSVRVVASISLYASDREKIALVIYGAATLVNALLDYFLIPPLGYRGAAIGSLIAEIALTLAYCGVIREHLKAPRLLGLTLKIMLACAFMGVVLLFSRSTPVALRVALGVVSYSVGLFWMGIASPVQLKRLWRNISPTKARIDRD